jgi:hypothetical protein
MSLTGTPKVNIRKLTVLRKRGDTIEGFKYGRIRLKKRGHFINLTEKSPDIKNYPQKEGKSRRKRTSVNTTRAITCSLYLVDLRNHSIYI